MIKLTRINGKEFIVNCRLIKYVEATPDTLVTLRDGEKIMVKESPADIVRRVIDFERESQVFPEKL